MKKSTKLLCVIMSIIMIFTSIPLYSSAGTTVGDTSSLDSFLKGDNLSGVVTTLINDLNDRKSVALPTVLKIAAMIITSKKSVDNEEKNKKIENVILNSTEQNAKILLDAAQELLAKIDFDTLLDELKPLLDIANITPTQFKSIDGIIAAICSSQNYLSMLKLTSCGDLDSLNVTAVKNNSSPVKRSDGNLAVINALLQFSKDNLSIVENVIEGKLNVGKMLPLMVKIATGVDLSGLIGKLNSFFLNLDKAVAKIIYNSLLADKTVNEDNTKAVKVEYEKTEYTSFTLDEMVGQVMYNVVANKDYFKDYGERKFLAPDKTRAGRISRMSIRKFLSSYGDKLIETQLLDTLNITLRQKLKDFLNDEKFAQLNDALKNLFDIDGYLFTNETFNMRQYFADGFFENINNVFVDLFNTILTPTAKEKINLISGNNSNLDKNIRSLFSYILTLMRQQGEFYGFDFSEFTDDVLETMSSEDMAVAVLNVFFPKWFGESAPNAKKLEQMTAFAFEKLTEKFIDKSTPEKAAVYSEALNEYREMIYTDGKFNELPQTKYYRAFFTLGVAVAETEIADSSFGKSLKFTATDGDCMKKLDNIVNFFLDFFNGLYPMADDLKNEPYGAFYKINVLFNGLFPTSILNGTGDGATFTADVENIIFNKILPALTDVSFKNLTECLYDNGITDDESLIGTVVGFIDQLLFSFLENENMTCITKVTKNATEFSDGYTISEYYSQSGKYIIANECFDIDEPVITTIPTTSVIPTTDTTTEENTTEESTTAEFSTDEGTTAGTAKDESTTGHIITTTNPETTTKKPTTTTKKVTTTNKPDVTFTLGDVNGDGKITPPDARMALRISARLEKKYTEQMFKAADIDGNGKVSATDARKILRFTAKLDKVLK